MTHGSRRVLKKQSRRFAVGNKLVNPIEAARKGIKMIKNLSQLKKNMVKGAEFTILHHCRPEAVGEHRQVNVADSTGFYSIVPGEPDNKATLANNGKGSWLGWSKAPFWKFNGNVCSLYSNDKEQTEKSLIISFEVVNVVQ